jgi:hypothetical protein
VGQFREGFSKLRDVYDNKYRKQLEKIRSCASGNPTEHPSPIVDECLEYHVRTFVINGFFEALNWPIICDDDLPPMIPETPVQSLGVWCKYSIGSSPFFTPSKNKPIINKNSSKTYKKPWSCEPGL